MYVCIIDATHIFVHIITSQFVNKGKNMNDIMYKEQTWKRVSRQEVCVLIRQLLYMALTALVQHVLIMKIVPSIVFSKWSCFMSICDSSEFLLCRKIIYTL